MLEGSLSLLFHDLSKWKLSFVEEGLLQMNPEDLTLNSFPAYLTPTLLSVVFLSFFLAGSNESLRGLVSRFPFQLWKRFHLHQLLAKVPRHARGIPSWQSGGPFFSQRQAKPLFPSMLVGTGHRRSLKPDSKPCFGQLHDQNPGREG